MSEIMKLDLTNNYITTDMVDLNISKQMWLLVFLEIMNLRIAHFLCHSHWPNNVSIRLTT